MTAVSWQYESHWIVSSSHLWRAFCAVVLFGVFVEQWLPGAISASGGLAIALTTPLFGVTIAKLQAYELDCLLARNNQRAQAEFGKGVLEGSPEQAPKNLGELVKDSETTAKVFQESLMRHQEFSRRLVYAQAWIVGISSAIWATGPWIGNWFFHCGRLSC